MTYDDLKKIYTIVVNELNERGHAATFHEAYSGRGMDGRPCFAISGDLTGFELGQLWGIVCALNDYNAELWAPTSTDSMGTGKVFYHTTRLPERPTRLFYVTLTWDNWPEGGSYGTTLRATNHADAEAKAKMEMAELRAEEVGDKPAWVLKAYEHSWHVVDCWLVSDFVEEHT